MKLPDNFFTDLPDDEREWAWKKLLDGTVAEALQQLRDQADAKEYLSAHLQNADDDDSVIDTLARNQDK